MIKSSTESAAAEDAAIRTGAETVTASGTVSGLSVTNTPSSAECTSSYDTVMAQATNAGAYVEEESDLAETIDAVFQDIDAQMAGGISGE